jgi:large subunit ribosomal protein L24
MPARSRAIVERINMLKRHTRPNPQRNIKGGVVEREASLHVSKLMIVCPECGKPSRIRRRTLSDGRKVRACVSCEGVIDK